MVVPFSAKWLVTWTMKVSPQSALNVGPGIVPLKVRTKRSNPSGTIVVFKTESQYSRITPVDGVTSYLIHD